MAKHKHISKVPAKPDPSLSFHLPSEPPPTHCDHGLSVKQSCPYCAQLWIEKFPERARGQFYQANPDKWDSDFDAWLLENGIPPKYLSKVRYQCYERGHSSGYSEIMNVAYDYIELFDTPDGKV